MNYYELLEIRPDATDPEIRSAYRHLAHQHHPDHTGGADAAQFRKIQEAYDTLSDPVTRAIYDRELENVIPVRVVSRAATSDIYEVHPGPLRTSWRVREVRLAEQSDESLLEVFDDLFRQFFRF